jgi:hypothetical protein
LNQPAPIRDETVRAISSMSKAPAAVSECCGRPSPARRQSLEERENPAALELTANKHVAARIKVMNLED